MGKTHYNWLISSSYMTMPVNSFIFKQRLLFLAKTVSRITRLTQRAAYKWESARFQAFFYASAFSQSACPKRLTQTVGQFI
jgi:hypothetical protein